MTDPMSLIDDFLGNGGLGEDIQGGNGPEKEGHQRVREVEACFLRDAIHATTPRVDPAYFVCETTYFPPKLNMEAFTEAATQGGQQMFFKARDDVCAFRNSKESYFPLRRQIELMLLKHGGVKRFGRVETQVAVYKKGSTGYVKHCDCSEGCGGAEEERYRSEGGEGSNKRCITVIFYLGGIDNRGTCLRDWKEEYGGQLELFGDGEESKASVVPAAGTLLFFRSDVVPHLVTGVEEDLNGLIGRGAVTFWFWDVELESSPSKQQDWDDETASIMCLKTLPHVPPLPAGVRAATTFVNIGSRNDPELPLTILNLYLTHTNPDKLFVGICMQNDKGKPAQLRTTLLPEKWLDNNVRVIEVPPAHTTGPLFARSLASSMWRGEELFVQIDSHMR